MAHTTGNFAGEVIAETRKGVALPEGAIERLLQHYLSVLGPSLIGVVLYGSFARGQARDDSDIDLFVLADELPANLFERARFLAPPRRARGEPDVSVRGLTCEEWARDVAPLDLDIALDGQVVHDRDGYVATRLALLRQRIEEAQLVRRPDLSWTWRTQPTRRDWWVGWEGVRR